MKVTFDLSDNDLKHFRKIMREVRDRSRDTPEATIVKSALELIEEVEASEAPDFVRTRVQSLRQLIDMLEDDEWALSGKDRERVVRGIAYFAEPEDMIPDRVPVLGFLDDAIMVELVATELVHEIEGYTDFCQFRATREERFGADEDPATRIEWVEARRKQLHSRIRRRRSTRRSRGTRGGGGPKLGLW